MNEPVPADARTTVSAHEPVAVVGLACRLPGANGPDAYWRLLTEGRSAITDAPADRRTGAPHDDAFTTGRGTTIPYRGGFIDAPADFDADFFGISPREAEAMDPQARLVLELGWEALEHAALPVTGLPHATGVFVGADVSDYAALVHRQGPEAVGHHTATGLNRGLIAGRLSYALGVSGPSLTVDSAQSSSLVAVQLACDSLRSGDCELALAGGVHLNLTPDSTLTLAEFGGLSPDGLCHTFDARANGFVRGEGAAFVVLKPLARALADGDRVHAVIRGGAVNNDGTGATLTTPDAAAQEAAIRSACARAGVAPAGIDYVELHGTGTRVGDPVEAAALGAAIGTDPDRRTPLAVGSVKTNIGHLEGAAGIAGLLKTVLCLAHGRLVPSLNHTTPNPAIDLDGLGLRVQLETTEWTTPDPGRPLRAGVSSFGMGGTNAHLVLEQAPPTTPPAPRPADTARPAGAEPPVVPWLLSARSPEALHAQTARLAAHPAAQADPVDTGWSLLTTRTPLAYRAVGAATDSAGILRHLTAAIPPGPAGGHIDRPVFVFPGQGSQWAAMADELMTTAPAFADRIAECEAALAPHVDWSLSAVLRGDPGAPSLDRSDVEVVQPVLWAVMVSLAALWQAHGVRPAAVVGHSQGEIAAACVAGALSLEDGALAVAQRSKALIALKGLSGMMSVALPEPQARTLIAAWDGRVAVAAVNGPSSVVVSGDTTALDELTAEAEHQGVRVRRIDVDYASHSAHVEAVQDEVLRLLAPLTPRTPEIPFLSTVTGDWLRDARTDAAYWYANLRRPVLLEPAVRALAAAGHTVFVEVSPHPVLTTPVRETAEAAAAHPEHTVVTGTLRRNDGGLTRFYTSLGELWTRGADVDWTPAFAAHRPRTVDLPTYAFQRRRHWIDTTPGTPAHPHTVPAAPAHRPPAPATPTGIGTGTGDSLRLVRESAALILGHTDADAIDPARSFKDLGFDSVTVVELCDRLNRAAGLRLPATVVYEHPTPARLARHLDTAHDTTATEAAAPVVRGAANDEPIAIVSIGCRYPGGVRSPEDLWRLVREEADVISGFPTDRGWDLDALYDPDPDRSGTSYVREGGFLHDAAEFDAGFFGISPREALAMDPQQRLLLETTWEALERAGIDPHRLQSTPTGVFIGATAPEYGPRLHEALEAVEGHVLTGTTASVASGRIAYTLGLEGPAVTVDTACSSSLVALHMAVQSLRSGECSLAFAGGATVMGAPGMFVEFSRQRGLAADGRCKPFAEGADGTAWAEGVGVLLLERLSDARRNGHQVLAVVRGSAINQDGASNGLTAPNGLSQQRVIRAALANAGLSAVDVDAVEAHGTGTKLGDPIEAQALLATYGQDRDADRPLWLGSVKSNIGHSQAASGVAGVIKMVQAMRHGVLPRSLYADEVSSFVDWSAGAVEVLSEARPWAGDDRPRRAGVSSFGVSGTNAHVIIEQPAPGQHESGRPEPDPSASESTVPDEPASEESGPAATEPAAEPAAVVVPLLVSARSEKALDDQTERLVSHLRETDAHPVDVAWTLFNHRSVFENRAVLIGEDVVASGAAGSAATPPSAVFVFPGQGAQWVGMAVELLDSSPVFAARFGECAAALGEFVDFDLLEVVREGRPLDRVDVVQPVLWAVMVSLAALWESFGVRPSAVVGHSQGEIAAAVVAGALSLQDGARVAALRSRAITALAGQGGMVSVALSRERAEEFIAAWEGRISVAAVNGPTSVVVSGDADALDELVEQAGVQEVRVRRVEVDYASHSAHVERIRDELLDILAPVVPREPEVPFFSTVTGEWIESAQTDADYWYTNLRQTVQLEPAVRALVAAGHGAFLEMSPHPVLTVPVAETVEAAGAEAVVTGTLRRGQGGLARFYTSLGEAWTRGVTVDWTQAFAEQRPQCVELPTYAFQRQRFWLELPKASVAADPVDEAFWKSVEDGDLEGFARTLGIEDQESLGSVVPALSSWRKGRQARSTLDSWRYRIVWRPLSIQAPTGAHADCSWLLVVPETFDDAPLFRAVLGALTERTDGVSVLTVGTADSERQRLAERLRAEAENRTFGGVLSLTGLDELPHPEHASVPRGLAVSLTLVQALGDAEIQAPLWCLTRGAVATADDRAPAAPVQAGVWGLGRVAALEHPKRWGGLIDLPEAADESTLKLLVHLLAGQGTEDQIAVRAGKAYGRRLIRAPYGQAPATRSWKPSGTVLVTGGTGALGVRMARWLAGQGAARLVLTGRRGADTPGMDEVRRELEEQGTSVSVVACDMADPGSVTALVRHLEQEDVPPVRTVVHAAGISALGSLDDAGITDLVSTLSGKVLGADHLDAALDPAALDAVVYFSSISGTWGVADHGAYAAANAILDARAEQRRADGVPVLSVAWGPWAGGGMIAEDLQDTLRRRGVPVIDLDTAVTGLQQALDHDETLIALADVDWRRFAGVFTSVRRSDLLAELPEAQAADDENPAPGTDPAPLQHLAPLDPARRRTALLDLVSRQVATVLGHDSAENIDTELAFKDLGFDSLTAVELRNRLGRTTGLRLPTTVVFDHPSISALADLIDAQAFGSRQDPAETAAPVVRGAVDGDPIAIVSMGCRYPGGVRSPEDLWRVVREEADVISGFPTDRGWDLDALYDPDPDRSGTSYVRESGFLHDAAEFDAGFFGISPREALAMDPQQRLLLETTWETLERAGIDPRALRGSSTGVYLGLTDQEYAAQLRAAAGEAEGYLATGAAASVASGRVAYTLGLEGPAVTVDTACSSSLVALHMAVQSLRSGECSLALAGAVTVMSGPGPFVAFSRQRALSPDGRCKPFSAEADGFALSEGAGVLLLERLSDARRNGHEVLAVVRGSAINQDGASNGLTAPNGPSQQRVIQAALANAGLAAQDIDVVEAHGTGTKLGDPIEAQALLATYGQDRDADRPLWLGSVKSNIGHSQAASGVAGVIKMVQAMRHGVLPKSLHADEVSPFVDWSAGAVEVLSQARPWTGDEHPRRAGVSSFGISGTNAHVIIEQPAPVPAEPAPTDLPDPTGVTVPLLVSTRSEKALDQQTKRLLAHLRDTDPGETGTRPVDVAWTLFNHRSVFENRSVLIGEDVVASGVAGSASPPSAVFVFPGQGAQWVGMAVELLDSSTVFAARFGECAAALDGLVEWSLMDVVRGAEGAPGLDRVDVVQPVLWAVMVSLAALWESFGVRPSAVVGHSQGEIAAAVVAGALSLQDGARVAALRSRAITALAGQGGMVSVALSRERAEEFIAAWEGRISVAAVNGPTSVVVSGDADALDELVEQAGVQEVRVRRVEVDYASHSAHVERIREELLEVLAPVVPREPEVPFFSTVTGEWIESAQTDGAYWYTNLRQTVQLEPAVRALVAAGHGAFLEMSPHPVLTVPVAETVEAAGVEAVVTGTLRRGQGGLARFYTSLGEAWTRGVTVDWAPAFTPYTPRRVELPTYAFQRDRYWLELPKVSAAADPVDEAFWKSVEDGDLEGFARTLGIEDQESLGAVVPALSSWRRGRRERSTLDSWRYRIAWRPKPAQAAPAPGTPAPALDGTWLVAVPESHQDDTLVTAALDALHTAGARTVRLTVPDSAQRGELAGRLLADLPADVTPDGVLSLLAVNTLASDHSPGVSYGLLGSMALVQALDDAAIPGRLWCLTRGAVSTGEGDHAPDPAQAAVWGLARVIGLDAPDRCGGLVDLPAGDTESAVHLALPALLTPQPGEDGGRETEFAVRGGGVSVRRMIRTPLPTSARDDDTWRPRGTVLVTGGTGALGSQVARSLAEGGAEHLILTSRRGPEAPGASELSDELTALGCRVTVAACDVADRTALAALLAQVPDTAPLTAVVHTAGAVETARPLGDLAPEDAVAVMHAKVLGAQNLHELLSGHPLDAFVLFSSGAGVWGNGGQAPYAAANAHLDALAEQRRARGLPATSIAWGAWAGGGMVDEEVGEQLLRRGVPAMAPELAVRALAGAATGRESTLVVADIRWDRFLPAYCAHGHRPLIDEVPEVRELLAARDAARPDTQDDGADAATALLAELAALPEAKRRRRLVDLIRTHVGAVLGHGPSDTVKPGRAFRDMGFDSLTAVELRNRLSGVFGTRLSATIVFDHPTPNALADHLEAELLPEASGPATDLPAGLQQLEAAYRQASDPAARQALTASLRTLLDTWAASEEPEEATVDEELLAASDEDMFDLIDRELGIS
ncbi:type I polyketide synthase [Streptomyces sp. NPDC001185]|uniref:type I polyketide synthase n=1 Tax=Streptomyces sp. NPDC001185 TaxID=3154380 RepID=UPI00332B8F12